jgi:hypothetical protein
MANRDLSERVAQAAVQALQNQKYVGAVDVLMGVGFLQPVHFEKWRRGQVPYLESVIQCGRPKLHDALQLFRSWAQSRRLKPSESTYSMLERGGGSRPLQFSAAGNPETEREYGTQWIPPDLPEKKQRRLVEKAAAPKELVVFSILRDSKCSECQAELSKGSFLTMENEAPLCLECADLGHLEFLPRGDAALTRRSGKYSSLRAVVVQFSRTRGRYERQGLLVEPAALERAEQECLEDEELRELRRGRDAKKRKLEDAVLAGRMTEQILALYPGCPPEQAREIAMHTAARGSGRIGRTEAGCALDPEALRLAVIAAVRHRHTDYDELLMQGVERSIARERVQSRIEEVLCSWS